MKCRFVLEKYLLRVYFLAGFVQLLIANYGMEYPNTIMTFLFKILTRLSFTACL